MANYGKYTAQQRASKPHQTSPSRRTQSQRVPLSQQSKPLIFSGTRQCCLIDATALRIAPSPLPAPALNAGGSFPEAQGRGGGCQGPQPRPSGRNRSADSSMAAPRPLTRGRAHLARPAGNFLSTHDRRSTNKRTAAARLDRAPCVARWAGRQPEPNAGSPRGGRRRKAPHVPRPLPPQRRAAGPSSPAAAPGLRRDLSARSSAAPVGGEAPPHLLGRARRHLRGPTHRRRLS